MQIDRPIAIVLMLLGAFLVVFFLVMPEYRNFRELQTELAIKTAEYNAQYDYYNEIAYAYRELETHRQELKIIDDALPEGPDFGEIIYFLQNVASEDGIMVRNFSLAKSSSQKANNEDKNIVKEVVFSMDVLGNYKALERFLVSLQNSARIFEVTRISFGSASQPPLQSNQSQFQIQQTYVFNLEVKTHSY